MAHTPINITNLNFDELKQSIIDKIKGDPTFSDYDFEGAGLNVLMDILAYHMHSTSFLANMAGNEMFIDSAQLRESVVSKAKELGYTPRSKRAAIAHINISIPNVQDGPIYLTMPAGTRFEGTGGISFTTNDTYLLYPDNGNYVVNDVKIYEGYRNEFTYVVDVSDPDQRFIIPSEYADISTLKVRVKPNRESTEKKNYTLNDDITQLTPTSTVYFIHQRADGRYEVSFGDGSFGRSLENGEAVVLSYIITSGTTKYNGIKNFSRLMHIDGYYTYDVTPVITSYGGADVEETESIRHAAPKNFEAQNRAVIEEDYETILMNKYPFIESLNIWGGQDNDPPQYGKVFISIKASHADIISDNLKDEIINTVLKPYNTVTVVPEIVDPDITYIQLNGYIYYDQKTTTHSDAALKSITYTTIDNYFKNTTEQFSKPFYYSPMLSAIDSATTGIKNSLFTIKLEKRFVPKLQVSESRTLYFGETITPNTIRSTYYNVNSGVTVGVNQPSQIIDDGKGLLLVRNPSTGATIVPDAGTVDYETGIVRLTLYVNTTPDDSKDIRVSATPAERNIIPLANQILILDRGTQNDLFNRVAGVVINAYPIS